MASQFNLGDFKQFLKTGDENAHAEMPQGIVRRLPPVENAEDKQAALPEKVAKTWLKKTLAQHDRTYHPNGYQEGAECNFRAALMRGDGADTIPEEKKGSEQRFGLVKFEEKDGRKKITDLVDVTEVVEAQEEPAIDEAAACRYLSLSRKQS